MPTVDSLTFEVNGWTEVEREDLNAVWSDADDDILAVNVFTIPPDIPAMDKGVEAQRIFYREQTSEHSASIVSVELVKIGDVPCVAAILKAQQPSSGFTYQGSINIPRKDFSIIVRVQCREQAPIGTREAAVVQAEGIEVAADGSVDGWYRDPYDSTFDDLSLCSLSDDEKYDEQSPEHPLSRVRRKLKKLVETLQLADDIQRAAPHEGEA